MTRTADLHYIRPRKRKRKINDKSNVDKTTRHRTRDRRGRWRPVHPFAIWSRCDGVCRSVDRLVAFTPTRYREMSLSGWVTTTLSVMLLIAFMGLIS